MTSLYGQYIKERDETEILEKEFGYITYKILNNELHVFNLFVVKDQRNTGLGFKLCKELETLAKEKGCTRAMTTVVLGISTQTEALKFHLRYGLKLLSANKDYIILGKEI